MQYSIFDIEDFCKDAYFIHWVISPTRESDQFWKSFIDAHPHKADQIRQAQEYIKTIRFSEIEPDAQDLIKLKQRIWDDLDSTGSKVVVWKPRRYLVAASVTFILITGLWIFFQNKPAKTYQTAYGQIRTISLPDGSKVTLNARSEIWVSDGIENSKSREVWLNGEAYFEIAKRNGARFIVHTPDTQVEVLGTEFNVSTRRKQTRVVLSQGKVQLVSEAKPALVMKPGDMAIVHKNSRVRVKTVEPSHYDSWKNSYIIMDDKPVAEIVEIIEDSYGLHLQFRDTSLLQKKLSGKLLIKNPDDFLENLSTILQTELQKSENGYLFR